MSYKTPALLATLMTIGLIAAPAVSAGGPKHRVKRVDGPGSVYSLAVQIEDSARFVHSKAERTAGRVDYREARLLSLLHELDARASDFRRDLARRGPDARGVRAEFLQLERSYRLALDQIERTRVIRPVRHEFARMGAMLHDLDHRLDVISARYRGDRNPPRHRYRVRSGGSVRIGGSWDGGHADIGFVWDD